MNWPVNTSFETPAGEVLRKLGEHLQNGTGIIVFGSGALEITVCPQLQSVDVDIALDIAAKRSRPGMRPFLEDDLRKVVREAGLYETKPYIQVCFFDTFKGGRKWSSRAVVEEVGHAMICIPHPIDILYAKMHRLEEKDLEAFKMVRKQTGHPSPEEMLEIGRENFRDFLPLHKGVEHLVSSVRPSKIRENITRIWQEIYQRKISINQEIIVPGDLEASAALPEDTGRLKKMLGKIAGDAP